MQPTNWLNITKFLFRNPARFGVLAGKVTARVADGAKNEATDSSIGWIERNSQDAAAIALTIAPELWEEAGAFAATMNARGTAIVDKLPFKIGGGGDYRFLYWLVRLYQPRVVVETGVAAGWTSQAILSALHKNGQGELHSSDFPYFRVSDPEKYIGCVVDAELKQKWNLHLDGDAKALPKILEAAPEIDIFHYDSDKSYSGRATAISLIRPHLRAGGLIVMDDIVDNSWFQDYVEREKLPFTIIGKRVGVIGTIAKPSAG
ncbi:class I SAM-dependent methyltransferase [Rhizorhabdus wittichii]|uniref:Class I SAM-dependent methyltransferase n=1 Tax=Rhizorhabdus wittichii TaxID=160791 RepID=A0A975D2Q7_9SPHN|nr:class I SAM-dependent methyltransferase [Rhizorhabdus wittichii]QTH21741.1 class I SAM-dependent methyltransferase [Rhizorhabdus wittichii]